MPKVYNTDKDKVVGFKEEAEIIIDHLLRGPEERDVVLITGMGGLGKTTLAKRVYDDKRVVNYFDDRAWCTVSQEYQCNELLHKIYSQVCGSETKIDDVAEKLRKSLMGKRYLIVLDDVWSTEAWEELNRVFPSCDNGSRIVSTSRQENVVSDAKKVCLPFLTIDESWELLELKLFKEERCLYEFEKIGLEICKKCGGLPLVVCLVAGLLQGVEKKEQTWHQFLNTLNSLAALKDGIQSNDVIELSYKYLPHHLKHCFLYFAAFPEDEVIEISKLIRLWISEGFIDITEKDRVEDAAEDCLNQLVGNNLIMISERKYDGRILSCIIHDLVRDFCLQKANEENFLQIIKLEDELENKLNFTPHRLCYHRHGIHKIPSELVPWNSCIRAVLGFPDNFFSDDRYTYSGSWIAKKFERITILDLEFIRVDKSILSEVNSLIHLRYLALELSGSGFVSPLSLENLECLITLKLSSDSKLHLPMIFWNMRSLRHMINYHSCGKYCPSKEEETSTIEAIPGSEVLQTLDLFRELSIRDEHLLRKFPYLKYLSCDVSPSYPLAEIESLHHLESLKLFCNSGYPHLLNDLKLTKFPSSIKELLLCRMTLSLSAISIISQLPNLEALILKSCNTEGLEWTVEEDTQFPKLKYLELRIVGIEIWNIISAESFPCLEQLILERCYRLVEVPSSLVDSSTLKLISVRGCNPSTKKSVEKILEDAQDIGNEQLNVEICVVDLSYKYLVVIPYQSEKEFLWTTRNKAVWEMKVATPIAVWNLAM